MDFFEKAQERWDTFSTDDDDTINKVRPSTTTPTPATKSSTRNRTPATASTTRTNPFHHRMASVESIEVTPANASTNSSTTRIHHYHDSYDSSDSFRFIHNEYNNANVMTSNGSANFSNELYMQLKKDLIQDDDIRQALMQKISKNIKDNENHNYSDEPSKQQKKQDLLTTNILPQHTADEVHSSATATTTSNASRNLRRNRGLENDTFTLMMLSTKYGFAWMFLFVLFVVQLSLLAGILSELIFRRTVESKEISRTLDVPIANTIFVTVGQGMAIIFALFSQRDLLEGVSVFIALFKYENYSQLNRLPNGKRVRWYDTVFWIEKILVTYLMKIFISILALFTAMILIMQSTDLIDLLKDFTALFIVASLDNLVYESIGDGYFGHRFDQELIRKEGIQIQTETRFTLFLCKKIPVQSFIFTVLLSSMLSIWGYVSFMQMSGAYFFEEHPNCTAFDVTDTALKYAYWGDSYCDPR